MKKINILFALLFSFIVASAQETELKQKFILETLVEAPVFVGHANIDKSDQITFTHFLQQELEYLSELDYPDKEGIVGVRFTVNADGSLSKIHIENSVSKTLDYAVLHAIKTSDKKWLAGKINGSATAMEKTMYVKFDIPGNPNHVDMANLHLGFAMKQLNDIKNLPTRSLDKNRLIIKTQRKAKVASSHLANAEKYVPNDMSITFWQAFIYELQGNTELMNQRLEKYLELVEYKTLNEKVKKDMNLAVITFK
ncbi:energy transducer TonB [Carboxylicivirga sp. N1Y90]|uniref:energy transducer TonB n=1 Tax=Carboxylicivirga fragile TaxID=3417571 RepID=UPI003D3569C8|nr:energy transducer TonB [Marinilabiliaceae bacterium N1Y90]